MTGLTRQRRLEALTHDDFFVRDEFFDHWRNALDLDVEATRRAADAIQRFGWAGALEFPIRITEFPLDASLLDWLIEEVERFDPTSGRYPGSNHDIWLANWLAKGPLDAIEPYVDRLERASLRWTGRRAGGALNPGDEEGPAATARHRLHAATLGSAECLDILEESLAGWAAEDRFPAQGIARLEPILERLTTLGEPSETEIATWLAFDWEMPFEMRHYRAGLGIILAGRQAALPLCDRLIDLLEFDWDWWNEEILRALTAMKDPRTLRAILDRYEKLPWAARLFLSGSLESLRFPGTHLPVMALAAREPEGGLRARLGVVLADYGVPEAMELAEEIFREDPDDPERGEIRNRLWAIRRVLGEDDEALGRWRQTMEASLDRRTKALANFSSPALRVTPDSAPGRNDPCPCGSGKKFKKCCLNRAK